jgi:hypothetical protein
MVEHIADLVAEMAALRADNDVLRTELQDALALFEQASAVLEDKSGAVTRRRRRRAVALPSGDGRLRATSASAGRRRAQARGRRGRITPTEVTPQVIRAVIGKLGEATAAEIAAEIRSAGTPVSGRAVRWLAEQAGATVATSEDGRRRYRL